MKLPAASSGELTPKEIRTYDVGKISPADLNGLLFHLTQTLTIFSLNRQAVQKLPGIVNNLFFNKLT